MCLDKGNPRDRVCWGIPVSMSVRAVCHLFWGRVFSGARVIANIGEFHQISTMMGDDPIVLRPAVRCPGEIPIKTKVRWKIDR